MSSPDYDLVLNAFLNDVSSVKEALECNVDINTTRELRGDPDMGKATVLIFSSYSGGLEVVRYLVQLSAEITARDSVSQKTALEWAKTQGHSAVSTFLEEEIRRREAFHGQVTNSDIDLFFENESLWATEYMEMPGQGETVASVIPLQVGDTADEKVSLVRILQNIGGCEYAQFFRDKMGVEEIADFYYVNPLNWDQIEAEVPPTKVNNLKGALRMMGIPVNDTVRVQTCTKQEFGPTSNSPKLLLADVEEMSSADQDCEVGSSSNQKVLKVRPAGLETFDAVQKGKHPLELSPVEQDDNEHRLNGKRCSQLSVPNAPGKVSVPNAPGKEDKSPDVSLCVICHENVRDILLLPCKHFCVCSACFQTNTVLTCPVCQGAVVTGIEVYF